MGEVLTQSLHFLKICRSVELSSVSMTMMCSN